MRSRRDDIDPAASLARALDRGVVGFGDAAGPQPGAIERAARRVERFADVDTGSFVWTRDGDGLYWLGRIDGPYVYDRHGESVDLVHIRACRWLARPVPESEVPAAVIATFGRGGRNFQQTHGSTVGAETQRVWDANCQEPQDLSSQANNKPS
ncbi:GAF domain-containing protein [Mycolicibacterium sp. XJ1819]